VAPPPPPPSSVIAEVPPATPIDSHSVAGASVSAPVPHAAAASIAPSIDGAPSVGSGSGSGSGGSGGLRLTELCPEDRLRIVNLMKQAVRLDSEKKKADADRAMLTQQVTRSLSHTLTHQTLRSVLLAH
jgi:hypothetical protein